MNINRTPNIALRSRIFLGVMISLFLLALIPLTSCSPEEVLTPHCTLLSHAEDIDAWVEGEDGELDYRGGSNTWTSTNFETPRQTRVIGYALTEDSNIWDHPTCMILDLN